MKPVIGMALMLLGGTVAYLVLTGKLPTTTADTLTNVQTKKGANPTKGAGIGGVGGAVKTTQTTPINAFGTSGIASV